jgi:hypothetical protein
LYRVFIAIPIRPQNAPFADLEFKAAPKTLLKRELARRLSAAFISNQMGASINTPYKKTPEDVGDLWYFLAALADKLARESQEGVYRDWGRLATEIIQ